MKQYFILLLSCAALIGLTSCSSFNTPASWPVSVSPNAEAVSHMKNHVKFTGSGIRLTKQEQALLTFLDVEDNIADVIGKKNQPGSHTWSAAEIYRVDPGVHVSVLCENGYNQTAVYFHYDSEKSTWYRVKHLGEKHSLGAAVVLVK
ncbi:MAG: hypothetical protein ACSHX0_02055 [Akkermansiaceae bacterium]